MPPHRYIGRICLLPCLSVCPQKTLTLAIIISHLFFATKVKVIYQGQGHFFFFFFFKLTLQGHSCFTNTSCHIEEWKKLWQKQKPLDNTSVGMKYFLLLLCSLPFPWQVLTFWNIDFVVSNCFQFGQVLNCLFDKEQNGDNFVTTVIIEISLLSPPLKKTKHVFDVPCPLDSVCSGCKREMMSNFIFVTLKASFLLSPLTVRETYLPQRVPSVYLDLCGPYLLYLFMDFKIIWQKCSP